MQEWLDVVFTIPAEKLNAQAAVWDTTKFSDGGTHPYGGSERKNRDQHGDGGQYGPSGGAQPSRR